MSSQKSCRQNRSNDLSVSDQSNGMKITKLNNDCLAEIFSHLDLRSLIRVAVSSELLRVAACFAFHRKYSTKTVEISAWKFSMYQTANYFETLSVDECIEIYGLKMCLRFVRCFGSSIKNLEIKYNQRRYICVESYVNKYCADSLIAVSHWNKSNFSIETIQKPFIKVECIQIKNANLDKQFPFLPRCYPNVRHLNLQSVVVDHDLVEVSFPMLNHLSIDIEPGNTNKFSYKDVGDLLHMNPQIRSLNILVRFQIMKFSTLTNIVRNSPSISRLKVLARFVENGISIAELTKFTISIPSLVELSLPYLRFSVDNIITLIQQFKSLKKISFTFNNYAEYSDLMEKLCNQWQTSITFRRARCLVYLEHQNSLSTNYK